MRALACIVLSSCIVLTAFGCTCDDQNEQEMFCRADWAIKAKIIAQKAMPIDGEHKYEIDLPDTTYFKHSDSILNFTNVHLYTYSEYNDCAVLLQVNQTYIISGHYRNPGKAFFNICNWVRNWYTGLTDAQREDYYDYDTFCREEWH